MSKTKLNGGIMMSKDNKDQTLDIRTITYQGKELTPEQLNKVQAIIQQYLEEDK